MAALFGERPKRPSLGRDVDFLDLGGDSLAVVELQFRLRGAYGITLANFYEDTSVVGNA